MNLRHLFFLGLAIGLLVAVQQIKGQDMNYTHYTIESGVGLPSNSVYGILFDRDNILWATSDRGVWRYDGYSGQQYIIHDGLKESANLRIFLDRYGRIVVSSFNSYVNRIVRDSVKSHPISKSSHALAITEPFSSGFIQQITEITDSSTLLSFNRPGLFLFTEGDTLKQVTDHRKNHEKASIAIHYKPDEYYWDVIGMDDTCLRADSRVSEDKGWIYLSCGVMDSKNRYPKELCPIGEREFLFSYSKKVFHIKNGKIIAEQNFNKDVIGLFVDHSGSFWVGQEAGGVLRFPGGDLMSNPFQYLAGENISGIAQDHEGQYWFSTSDNGIFQSPTLDIAVYKNSTTNPKDNIFKAIATDGRNLYLGTETGILFKATKQADQRYILKKIPLPMAGGPIRKLFYTPENHILVFNDHLSEIDTLGRLAGIARKNSYPFDYIRKSNGESLVSVTGAILVYKNGREIRRLDKKSIKEQYPADSTRLISGMNRIRCMLEDSGGLIWLGAQSSGLLSSHDSFIYHWSERDTIFGKRPHKIIEVGENIWVSIADYGISVIRPDSSSFRITQEIGLSSDIIDVLFKENDTIVWAGTNNGLNRITYNPDSNDPPRIDYYTKREGLPSNRIYQVIKHDNRIWLGTSQGAIQLSPDFSKPIDILPKIVAGPLTVNGKQVPMKDSLVLSPDENNLVIHFKAISYRSPKKLQYRYKLSGIDEDSITFDNLEVRYPDLRFGNYTFSVNASYNGDFSPESEVLFHFRIQKRWYQTRLIIGILLLLLGILIFFIVRTITRSVRIREMEKRQLLMAEKKSLLAQMNPHFVFNSLNSIQHFILQNDEFQANNYLTGFSTLIRRILENSRKNVITLQEEINTLSLYLSMEKLRFENLFEYQIIKDNHLDYLTTMIPPMFLQPFVENAIWHGLGPLKSKGLLTIAFARKDDYFSCLIQDNGIGREMAAIVKGKKEPHLSSGITNVRERIELLNKINKKKITLTITDLRTSDGAASGTLIEILTPIDLTA